MVKPHIDTSLIYLEMVQYCKYLMYYLKHISNRLKKFFLIRIPNSFPPHKLDLGSLGRDVKKKKKSAFAPQWKGSCQVFLTTDSAAKRQGSRPLICVSQLKRALPDSKSSAPTTGLPLKAT